MDRKLFLFILCCLFFSMQVDSSPCRDAVNGKRRVFLPFEEAMEKVPDEITSAVKYKVWRKDHPDMPSNPQNFYRDQWQSWGHFLRTGRVVVWGRDFLSFEQAMEKVQKDGVSSEGEYRAWRKDHPDMPSHPEQVYRDQWQSWGHFLGTGRVGVKKLFLPYNKAMEKVRRAGVSSKEKYKAWRKDHPDMPSNPQAVYGNQWQSWGFFFGTGRVWGRDFLSFEQAMEKVRRAGVSSRMEYLLWRKDHPDMPSHPEQVYRDQWQNWGHFLGTL